jgi:hypothetical protein
MKVPSTTTLSFPTLSPLLTAGKNIVGYFLDSPRILREIKMMKSEIRNAYIILVGKPERNRRLICER